MSASAQPAVAGRRREVVEAVRGLSREALVATMIEQYRDSLPSYRRMQPEVLALEISSICTYTVDLFSSSFVADRAPSTAELEPLRASAKRGAADGARLEEILRTYMIGARVWLKATTERLADADPLTQADFADALLEFVETCTAVVAVTYVDERLHSISERERLLRDAITALGASVDVGPDLAEVLHSHGLDQEAATYAAFAFCHEEGERRMNAALAASLRAKHILAVSEGDKVIGVASSAALVGSHSGYVSIVGEEIERDGLTDSLDEIREAAGLALAQGRSGRVEMADLLPELMLARSPHLAATLRRDVLDPLRDQDERLVETLRIYLERGSKRTVAAKELGIHPNTMDLRLRRIEELTGLSAREGGGLLRLMLALRLLDG